MPASGPRKRSTLSRDEARLRYAELGQLAALEQIHADSEQLDRRSIAVGPFARLDANAVAAGDGKTRGAITNLFGSQTAFQVEAMEHSLNAEPEVTHPSPADYDTADEWIDALFAAESARGPRHGAPPSAEYSSSWALWLSAVPYGLWSEQISGPSMDEYRESIRRLEAVLAEALERFGMTLREGTSLTDLASAMASQVEGAWLNQCLTTHHPTEASAPIAELLRRSGRLLWLGATEPRAPGGGTR